MDANEHLLQVTRASGYHLTRQKMTTMTDTLKIAQALIKAKELREASYETRGPKIKVEGTHLTTGARAFKYVQEGVYKMGWHEAAHLALGVPIDQAGHQDVRLVVILAENLAKGGIYLDPLLWANKVVVEAETDAQEA